MLIFRRTVLLLLLALIKHFTLHKYQLLFIFQLQNSKAAELSQNDYRSTNILDAPQFNASDILDKNEEEYSKLRQLLAFDDVSMMKLSHKPEYNPFPQTHSNSSFRHINLLNNKKHGLPHSQ